MPYVDIRLSGPCLPQNIEKFAAVVQCVAPTHWYVGGAPVSSTGRATFFVEANITAGTNTAAEKAAFIAAAFAVAEGILGRLDAASYVIVREVPADAWGYQGFTQAARRGAL